MPVKAMWGLLRRPTIQRAVRAATAAGLAWQLAVLLPSTFAQYAYYAPLGAIIAVHPTVADSASATWRTVLAIVLGAGVAVGVFELTRAAPAALTLALLVAVSIAVEQWRALGTSASWVSVAAVFMLTVGSGDPAEFAVAYAGLVLLGAAVGVLVTSLSPPLQLTSAVERVAATRALLAEHLEVTAVELREGRAPTTEEAGRRASRLSAALDRMRDAVRTVERARQANPRARRRREPVMRLREESRALDRVAVLVDDVTELVAEYQPQHHGGERPELGTARRLADALDGLAGVVRTPHHADDRDRPDDRDHLIRRASNALDELVARLRRTTLDEDPGYLALAAVGVGLQRALQALDGEEREPSSR